MDIVGIDEKDQVRPFDFLHFTHLNLNMNLIGRTVFFSVRSIFRKRFSGLLLQFFILVTSNLSREKKLIHQSLKMTNPNFILK